MAKGLKQELAAQAGILTEAIDSGFESQFIEHRGELVRSLAIAVIAEELGRLNQHLDTLCVIASDKAVRP